MKRFFHLPPYWKAALWKIWACFCFALVNGLVRLMTGGAEFDGGPSPITFAQIAFMQTFIGACLLLPWSLHKGKKSFKTSMPFLHTFRIVFAASGLLLWYAALYYMPISSALALSFTGPIITIIACRIFLKEKLYKSRILAITCSILGAFVITRPDQILFSLGIKNQNLEWTTILPIISASCWVGSKIISRRIASNGDSPQLMTLYLLTFIAPVSFIPAIFVWRTLNLEQLLWCIIIGLISTIAHLSTARAFSLAEISFLTPFGFARLFLSTLIGYVIFGEFPVSIDMWVGIVLIIVSLIILSCEKKFKKRKKIKFSPLC